MRDLRIAVVGGGLAGLSAAVYLSQHGHGRVTVFEAASHLGGQAASWRDVEGAAVETGIHLAFPWYVNFRRLYQDVGRPLQLVETDGNYYLLDGRSGAVRTVHAGRTAVRTLYGLAVFPGLTLRERLKLARHVWRILRTTDVEAEARDEESVAGFLERAGATPGMIRQLSVVPVTIQGLRASDASAASYIKFLRTLYGSVGEFEAAFFDAPLEESLTRPLVDFVLARAGEIRCGARIAEVAADEGGRATGVVTAAGERADGFDAVVVAVPGYLVPALVPEAYRRREPFTRLAMLASASVVTLTLWYAQRVLPDGNVRISNREGVVFDAVTDKAYHWTGWRGGSVVQVLIDAADDLAHASDEDIYGRVLADLRRFFPACRHSVPRKWDLVRHRDIYCAPRPGYWALVPRTHHTPLVNLYLAGDYTDGPYHYGMESAVISGKAVARAIVARAGLAPLPEPVLRVPYLRFVAQGGP